MVGLGWDKRFVDVGMIGRMGEEEKRSLWNKGWMELKEN